MKYVIILKSRELDSVLVNHKVYSTVKRAFSALKLFPEASLTWWSVDKRHHKLINKEQNLEYYIQELEEE